MNTNAEPIANFNDNDSVPAIKQKITNIGTYALSQTAPIATLR